jgi:hypothetical protein
MKKLLNQINTNKLFLGIMMILLNLGSRHLVDEFSTSEAEHTRNIVLRRIAVFAVCFVGTRDIVTSIILTAGFVILATGVAKRKPNEGFEQKKTTLASPYTSDPPLLSM